MRSCKGSVPTTALKLPLVPSVQPRWYAPRTMAARRSAVSRVAGAGGGRGGIDPFSETPPPKGNSRGKGKPRAEQGGASAQRRLSRGGSGGAAAPPPPSVGQGP